MEYRYVQDDNGNLLTFEDGEGYDYTFSYNQDGFQNSSGYPDGTSTKFMYDEEGHLATLVNQDNSTIQFSYDDDDNLVRNHSKLQLSACFRKVVIQKLKTWDWRINIAVMCSVCIRDFLIAIFAFYAVVHLLTLNFLRPQPTSTVCLAMTIKGMVY